MGCFQHTHQVLDMHEVTGSSPVGRILANPLNKGEFSDSETTALPRLSKNGAPESESGAPFSFVVGLMPLIGTTLLTRGRQLILKNGWYSLKYPSYPAWCDLAWAENAAMLHAVGVKGVSA